MNLKHGCHIFTGGKPSLNGGNDSLFFFSFCLVYFLFFSPLYCNAHQTRNWYEHHDIAISVNQTPQHENFTP